MERRTKTVRETQDFARTLMGALRRQSPRKGALVLALEGELGSGKTAFTQGIAKALGIREAVQSPTFVLMRVYALRRPIAGFRRFAHIDAYRLGAADARRHLGLPALLADRETIVAVEWASRIRALLPPDAVWISFAHEQRRGLPVRQAGRAIRVRIPTHS
ncbi:tRNA (adenosine(37)-N6)-threonylcarbamoyltransferase complex ATPase subunit type 1 TsaE [Candidatus Parcubacteria bacterium]|nr:MAG: tRNA (adenosine(37)-N6)-threonylcarbamoyltransferase complex ATPase subunit type 1 TsaE [Candidatus Parcubacteria bacterium]